MTSAVSPLQQLSGNKIKTYKMRPIVCVIATICMLFSNNSAAQSTHIFKVAVFAPIYLDAAFDGTNYKLGYTNLPRNILPGLEFYNGVMMAIDSLNAEGVNAEVLFYDLKNSAQPIHQLLKKTELADVSLIIASFNNRNDIKPLADFAYNKKIPLISETYPNDGGVSENPYFVLINSTLKTHVDALYKYVQRTYPTANLIWIKRKGVVEDMIQQFFTDMQKKTPAIPLKIKTMELVDTFTTVDFISGLDSNKQNILICGSLNESFGIAVMKTASANRDYNCSVIGMPTWDGFKDLGKSELKGIELIYSSPYYFPRTDKTSQLIISRYKNKFLSRPSDQVLKGFESMYHFTKLLLKYKDDLIHNLSDKSFKVFNDFDIQPIKFKRENLQADYLENKKLYFIKKVDGQIKSAN